MATILERPELKAPQQQLKRPAIRYRNGKRFCSGCRKFFARKQLRDLLKVKRLREPVRCPNCDIQLRKYPKDSKYKSLLFGRDFDSRPLSEIGISR